MNELVAALLRPPGDALLAGGGGDASDGSSSGSGGGKGGKGGGLSVAQLPLGTANDLAAAAGISLVRSRARRT